jgi:hypothetical protein
VNTEEGLQFTGAENAAFHVVVVPTSQHLVKWMASVALWVSSSFFLPSIGLS